MKSIGKIIDDGGQTELQGDIVLMIAVDKDSDHYDGKISFVEGEVDGFDMLTLAGVTIEQCFYNAVEFMGLEPNVVKEALKNVLSGL